MTSTLGDVVWAILALAALVVWAFSHAGSKHRVVARPASALARLASDPWLRVPLLVGWAWAGWHLFAR